MVLEISYKISSIRSIRISDLYPSLGMHQKRSKGRPGFQTGTFGLMDRSSTPRRREVSPASVRSEWFPNLSPLRSCGYFAAGVSARTRSSIKERRGGHREVLVHARKCCAFSIGHRSGPCRCGPRRNRYGRRSIQIQVHEIPAGRGTRALLTIWHSPVEPAVTRDAPTKACAAPRRLAKSTVAKYPTIEQRRCFLSSFRV